MADSKKFKVLRLEMWAPDLKLIDTLARYFHVTRGDMIGVLLSRGMVETLRDIDTLKAKKWGRRRSSKR